MPTSWVITSAISSRRASSSSATRQQQLATLGRRLVSDQPGNAALAAATARSMSAGVPAGIVAKTSSVVESITSSVSLPGGRDPRAVDVELVERLHGTLLRALSAIAPNATAALTRYARPPVS